MQGIPDSVKSTVQATTGLPADFAGYVALRLQSLGYTLQDSDSWALAFAVAKVLSEIKDSCNVSTVPDGLTQVAADMVCGEFLLAQKGSGQLTGFSVDLDSAALKQIGEGDTNIVFAVEGVASPEKRLDALIDRLINCGKGQFASYRRLKWT